MKKSKSGRARTYKIVAWILGGFGIVVMIATWTVYRKRFSGDYSPSMSDWGLFGDYLGGVAGTMLVFATLIALVVALVAQSTELEQTQETLAAQVKATNNQIRLIDAHETRRMQPVLKVEWFANEPHVKNNWATLRFTNIGLGPCHMERVHVFVDGTKIGDHDLDNWEAANEIWINALERVINESFRGPMSVNLAAMNQYRKYLAAGEPQQMLTVDLGDIRHAEHAVFRLQQRLGIEIEFKSMSGVEITTAEQEKLFIKTSKPTTQGS